MSSRLACDVDDEEDAEIRRQEGMPPWHATPANNYRTPATGAATGGRQGGGSSSGEGEAQGPPPFPHEQVAELLLVLLLLLLPAHKPVPGTVVMAKRKISLRHLERWLPGLLLFLRTGEDRLKTKLPTSRHSLRAGGVCQLTRPHGKSTRATTCIAMESQHHTVHIQACCGYL